MTTVYGSYVNCTTSNGETRQLRVYATYTWNSTYSNTQSKLNLSAVGYQGKKQDAFTPSKGSITCTWKVTTSGGASSSDSAKSISEGSLAGTTLYPVLSSGGDMLFIRETFSYTVTVTVTAKRNVYTSGTSSKSVTFTVPALPSYAVTYSANGGSSTPAAQTKYYGKALALRGAISRADSTPGNYTVTLNGNGAANPSALTSKRTTKYSFSKWGTATSGGTTYAAGASYTGNAKLNLYAQWTTSETRAAVTLPTPSRSGFSFVRWNTNNVNTGTGYAGGSGYTPSGNVTLYAIWNRTVTYNANKGSGAPSAQTALATSAITLSSTKPTRSDYAFVRWNTNASNTGTGYAPGQSYPAQTAGATLYAIWNRTVTFNGNGNTGGSTTAQTALSTAAITVAANGFSRTGHRFVEWNTRADGTGDSYAAGASYPADNPSITLYAIWKRLPTATAPAVERCDANGVADPLGAYVRVSSTWATYDDVQGQDCTIEVLSDSTVVSSRTVALSGTSGTVSELMGGALNPNAAYTVRVTPKDAQGDQQQFAASLAAPSGYFAPRAASVLAQRCLPDGTLDDEGTCALVTVGWSVFDGSEGTTFAPSVTGTWEDSNGNAMAGSAYTLTQALSGAVSGTTMSGTAQLLFADLQPTSDTSVDPNEGKAYFTSAGVRVLSPSSDDVATYYEAADLFASTATFRVEVSVTDGVNSGGGGDVLTTAYYTMDVLGDCALYNPTTDTAVDSSKTYYRKVGQYDYVKVDDPVTEEIASYYEANGETPGHGISFGAPAKHEGFNVSMPQYAYERRMYPTFVYSDFPTDSGGNEDESQLPTTPCFVLVTSSPMKFYYCDGI